MTGAASSAADSRTGCKTLLLHAGLPKTASTWLQAEVFPRLPLRQTSMPRTEIFKGEGNEGSDRLLVATLARAETVWSEMGDEILAALTGGGREEELTRNDDLLVSEEGVGRVGTRPGHLRAHLEALRETAAGWGFARIRVLCLLRRQDAWFASHYAQVSDRNLRAGQADFEATAARLADPRCGRHGFGALLDYHALHAAMAAALGREAVLMLPYELLTADRLAFDRALSDFLGGGEAVRRALETARETTTGRSNVRSAEGGWRLRPRLSRTDRLLAAAGLHRPLKRIELTPEISRRLMEAFAPANAALAAETGLDLARFGYC
jgi:hypothetical protein